MNKQVSPKLVRLVLGGTFGFLNARVKAVAALSALGFDRMVDPSRPLPNHTGLAVTIGVLAALDALAWFGVIPEWVRCTADEPCEECLQFVEEHGFHPYASTAAVDPYDHSAVYTDEEGLR